MTTATRDIDRPSEAGKGAQPLLASSARLRWDAAAIGVGILALYAIAHRPVVALCDPADTLHQVLSSDLGHRPVMFLNLVSTLVFVRSLGVLGVEPASAFCLHGCVWGAVGAVALYLFMRELSFSRDVSRTGAGLLAFGGMYWWQAEKADVHVMWMAFMLLAGYLLLKRRYAIAGLSTACALATYPIAALFIPVLVGLLVLNGTPRRARIVFAVCAALPYFTLVAASRNEYLFGRWGILAALLYKGGTLGEASVALSHHLLVWGLMSVRSFHIGWLLLPVGLWSGRKMGRVRRDLLILTVLGAGPLLLSLVSPFEEQGYIMGFLPWLCIWGALAFQHVRDRRRQAASLCFVALFGVASYVLVVSPGQHDLANIRSAAIAMREGVGQSAVYISTYSLAAPFSLYLCGFRPEIPYPQSVWGPQCVSEDSVSVQQIARWLGEGKRVFHIVQPERTDPVRDLVKAVLGSGDEDQSYSQVGRNDLEDQFTILHTRSYGALRIYEILSRRTVRLLRIGVRPRTQT